MSRNSSEDDSPRNSLDFDEPVFIIFPVLPDTRSLQGMYMGENAEIFINLDAVVGASYYDDHGGSSILEIHFKPELKTWSRSFHVDAEIARKVVRRILQDKL